MYGLGLIVSLLLLPQILGKWRWLPPEARGICMPMAMISCTVGLVCGILTHSFLVWGFPEGLFHIYPIKGAEGIAAYVGTFITFNILLTLWLKYRIWKGFPTGDAYEFNDDRGDFNDTIAAPAAFIVVFFKAGCLFAGCCYGRLTKSSFSLVFPPDSIVYKHQVNSGLIDPSSPSSLPVLPSQPLEMLLMFLMGRLLLYLFHRRHLRGHLIYIFFIYYSAWRIASEMFLRGDPHRGTLGPITVTQFFSLLIIVASIIMMIIESKRKRPKLKAGGD